MTGERGADEATQSKFFLRQHPRHTKLHTPETQKTSESLWSGSSPSEVEYCTARKP
jgi:hypothetical protein